MKTGIATTRRQVLRQLAALLGAASLPLPLASAGTCCRATDPELAAAVAALLPNAGSAAAIGREYLRECRQERSAQVLQAAIRASLAAEPVSAEALRGRIALDFRTADTVTLRGWILSRTEARLCALYALYAL
ncbi:MAG: hypothetical protein WD448_04920 [Woeseia sp.]